MSDLSKEQAIRWVTREFSRLVDYDDIINRLETERIILSENAEENALQFPVTARARQVLIARLEMRLADLRKRLH